MKNTMAQPKKKSEQQVATIRDPEEDEEEEEEPEDGDEFDDDEDDDEFDDEDDYVDMSGLLTGLLSTEEGDTLCTALMKINTQLETQNKILVKLLTAFTASQKK
jgi:hypothetical protein